MLYFKDQYATVWKIDQKEKYTEVTMSTSRKDKRDNSYVNSNWSFVRFLGKAHEKASELERQTRIVCNGSVSIEPYMKDGEKAYPKSPQIVVFDFSYPEARESNMDTPPNVEDDDEIPF